MEFPFWTWYVNLLLGILCKPILARPREYLGGSNLPSCTFITRSNMMEKLDSKKGINFEKWG